MLAPPPVSSSNSERSMLPSKIFQRTTRPSSPMRTHMVYPQTKVKVCIAGDVSILSISLGCFPLTEPGGKSLGSQVNKVAAAQNHGPCRGNRRESARIGVRDYLGNVIGSGSHRHDEKLNSCRTRLSTTFRTGIAEKPVSIDLPGEQLQSNQGGQPSQENQDFPFHKHDQLRHSIISISVRTRLGPRNSSLVVCSK